jgi:hypothetical protein
MNKEEEEQKPCFFCGEEMEEWEEDEWVCPKGCGIAH